MSSYFKPVCPRRPPPRPVPAQGTLVGPPSQILRRHLGPQHGGRGSSCSSCVPSSSRVLTVLRPRPVLLLPHTDPPPRPLRPLEPPVLFFLPALFSLSRRCCSLPAALLQEHSPSVNTGTVCDCRTPDPPVLAPTAPAAWRRVADVGQYNE